MSEWGELMPRLKLRAGLKPNTGYTVQITLQHPLEYSTLDIYIVQALGASPNASQRT